MGCYVLGWDLGGVAITCYYLISSMRKKKNLYIYIYSYMILLSLSHAVSTLRCEYYVSQIHNTLRCTLLVHTGGIDGMWKISKGAVSASWSTRKDGAVNLILSC